MEFRKATIEDLDRAMDILDLGRKYMRANNNTAQWVNGYPSREAITADIEKGVFYVALEDGEIRACFSFILGTDPTYLEIEGGEWLNAEPYGTIHRMASDGKARRVFRNAVEFCFTMTDNLRMDTHRLNVPMRRACEREGFKYCGVIYIADGTPRDAFQLTKADWLAAEGAR